MLRLVLVILMAYLASVILAGMKGALSVAK